MKRFIIIVLLPLLLFACSKKSTGPALATTDLLDRIRALPGVTALEISPPAGYHRAFEIDLIQPLDPQNPEGPTFAQKLYLSHLDDSALMVLQISGYHAFRSRIDETADILQANQVYVGHRYIGKTRPDPPDWQHLTVANAAADHHRIVELFKQIYPGTWVSAGTSKGGIAALCHRRFYPDDVAATVAKVAPLMYAAEDPRFDVFLEETAGDAACRNKIKQFQRTVLAERDSVVPHVQALMDGSGYSYSFSAEEILELVVLEYPFAFWQASAGDCTQIPESDASGEELYSHLAEIVGLSLYSTTYLDYYGPVFYQAFTEFGYYGFVTDHLEDLLVAVENPSNALFAPSGVDLAFKPEIMADIINWLQTQGDNIIYIYGGQDPWTAAAIELTGQTNALKIVQDGANHNISIADLDNRELIYSTLEEWLGIEIQIGEGPVARPFVEQTKLPRRSGL